MHEAIIKLYGEIWSWNLNNSELFTNRLNGFENDRNVSEIHLHIHCLGGEVLEGIAIINAIKACKKPVIAYIDGVSASMATLVMLACDKIYMADNAYIMIHSPRGGAYGTAKDMAKVVKLLKAMEVNFKKAYSTRTGKPEAEVALWMDGDNWFSASEALAENLIDGIFDAVDTTQTNILSKEDVKDNTVKMMYQRYAALNTSDNNKSESQKPKNKMDKQKIIAQFGLTSVTVESSEDEIYSAISAKMNAETTARQTVENTLKTEKENQVKAVVAAAKTAGKITDAQVVSFEAIGINAGIEALQTALDAIKSVPSISALLNNGIQSPQTTEPKTFTELQALGDVALAAWKRDRPQDYARLYKAEFGHDINV
ncbi:head maturation protease, ClpP-related [Dysgonomonas sp. 520]|uniref:head maturation protease, ClpP-related n=1 Tax=Dysgonomonas sp. 520 TaxID=2302931 RepID=UPI0013D02916|nr:head maturation protease, ClpP-related [Dysgonomonas sp. 520]NDW10944.1 Clp protease ClpP [Dysgonomonas sp. 520]